MKFTDRTEKSNRLIALLKTHYWDTPQIRLTQGMFHEPYGYENHISPETQNVLKKIYTITSKHIRFTPDYIVGRRGLRLEEPVLLLEYKVTTTPRYTLKDGQWDSGQIEADAWDNYMNLINAGVRVALLIYCPYHSRPLLCDVANDEWLTEGRNAITRTYKGSGTDYCNIALPKLRTFVEFMEQQFMVPADTSKMLIEPMLRKAIKDPLLQITHDPNSSYQNYKTGFNWDWDLYTRHL
jgi:hypothetical protein